MKQDFSSHSQAFVGRALENLSQLIERQSQVVLENAGVTIPVKSCSTLTAIAVLGEASTSDIARYVKTSHQLIKQKLSTLEKSGTVSVAADQVDKRRRLYSLTEEGKLQVQKLDEVLPEIARAYDKLFAEIGLNLNSVCHEVEAKLEAESLADRVSSLT